MPENLENSAVATGLEKDSFHSNSKKSHRNYEKNYRYKIDNIYQKAKIKNLE